MISYKTLLSSCFIFLFILCGNAQETTYYYKQIRVVKEGNDIASPSGGQFISFFSSVCYESDNMGVSVGHGILERKNSGKYVEYRGESYWGENTLFKFNSSLDRLNVVTPEGVIYVYIRGTAPVNITTCSLIKGKTSVSSSTTKSGLPYSGYAGNYNTQLSTSTGVVATQPAREEDNSIWEKHYRDSYKRYEDRVIYYFESLTNQLIRNDGSSTSLNAISQTKLGIGRMQREMRDLRVEAQQQHNVIIHPSRWESERY